MSEVTKDNRIRGHIGVVSIVNKMNEYRLRQFRHVMGRINISFDINIKYTRGCLSILYEVNERMKRRRQ